VTGGQQAMDPPGPQWNELIPRAEDIDEDWHTNLGLFTWGLDALGERLFGTARTENSPVLKELLLDLAIISTRRQGDVLELRIETSSFAPGEYHFWIRYGQRDVLFIPIELLK